MIYTKTREGYRWYYRLPGNFLANGPTTARFHSEHEARVHIRKCLGVTRLPRGTEVWPAS